MNLESFRLALADIVTISQRAFSQYGRHECAQRSAALAYYALFSLFPLLLLAISTIGFMLEAGMPLAVDAQSLVLQASEQALPQATDLVEQIIVTTRQTRGGTGVIGLIVLIWSASHFYTHLRLSLNVMWDTGLPQGIIGVMRLRVTALAMVLSTGLLFFLLIVSDGLLAIIARYVTLLPWSDTVWLLGRPLLITGLTALLFALIYRIMPSAPVRLVDVWPGAIVAAVGWELLKWGFVWYATSFADWTRLYGPIAGVIGLLLWLYLSAQLVLFGAEFSAAYSRQLAQKHAGHVSASPAQLPGDTVELQPDTASVHEQAERQLPAPYLHDSSVARGTAVGLVGLGVASVLAVLGLLATGRRLLTRRGTVDTDAGSS
jgi:membrane protein